MDIQHITSRVDPNQAPQKKQPQAPASKTKDGLNFSGVLREQHNLEFSGHALKRLKNRSISMNELDIKRLEDAMERVEEKGGRDSLVMDGDRAFLVNVPSRKVVTAVDIAELRHKVFTNIDSTVLTRRL
jgi:flagellar operon protein